MKAMKYARGSLCPRSSRLRFRRMRRDDTHNLVEVNSGFSNGLPSSTDGQRYAIIHEHLMKLCYSGRIRVVDDRVVGVANGRADIDAGELVYGAHLLHGWALWVVALRQSVYGI